ncbi:MAG: hypothetical protein GX265_00700 [Mollicutes bacterium]|nr:hypothetical protein [Mollicutes bacterium]
MKKKIKQTKSFLNSPHVVLIPLIIINFMLLYLGYHLMKTDDTYMFSGTGDYVNILNGVVSLNYDINLFEGSSIEYTKEKDVLVTEYKAGYYIVIDDTLVPFLTKTNKNSQGESLKQILEEEKAFTLTEPYTRKEFFTKDVKKAFDNGLFFIVEAKTKNNEEILDKIEISISKISK